MTHVRVSKINSTFNVPSNYQTYRAGRGGGAVKSKQTKFSNMEVLFVYINPNIE